MFPVPHSPGSLGNACARLGEIEKAIGFYEQALTILREIGDRRGEAYTLGNLGYQQTCLASGDLAFLWTPEDGYQVLPLLPGAISMRANDINGAGTIVWTAHMSGRGIVGPASG